MEKGPKISSASVLPQKGHIKEIVEKLDLRGKILDVGSSDLGSNPRYVFDGRGEYTGIDISEGKNVDIVISPYNFPFKNEEFDVVLCLSVIEHDLMFWKTIAEVKRVLKKNGILIISAPEFPFPIHKHPSDYYRFTEDFFLDFVYTDIAPLEFIHLDNRTLLTYGRKRQ